VTIQKAKTRCIGVRRNVLDLHKSVDFYSNILDFELVSRRTDSASLRLGTTLVELSLASALRNGAPARVRSHDRSFRHLAIVVRDMNDAFARLTGEAVELISSGPQTLPQWNPGAGGIQALYFRDPSQHPLELIQFPENKGKAIWHRAGKRLFMGLDHTAIVVADTATSRAFYRKLGFEPVTESHNYGPEQEALTGVPGASVRISSLQTDSESLGLELIEYLEPKSGRAMPEDISPGHPLWSETLIATSAPDVIHRGKRRDPDGYGVDIR
jgi:catechol 2,3-dioxygenase-like lactoylglutathione lyase family enzyme